MRFIAFLLIYLLCLSPPTSAQDAAPEDLPVFADGVAVLHDDPAAAEEEAVWDAKRNAVEQAAGFFLKARSVGRDFVLETDRIESQTSGFVKTWEIVPASRRIETVGNGKLLHIKVRAVIALLPVIRRLRDIQDVYNDLERPRVRIEMTGDTATQTAQNIFLVALKAQGFEVATSGPAEIVLSGKIAAIPTIHLGDKEAVFGIGESVAACRAEIALRVISTASEENLYLVQGEAAASSFQNDADARSEATAAAARILLEQEDGALLQHLLVRWARERQEGHAVALEISNLDARRAELLRTKLREMRGFVHYISHSTTAKTTVFRFITRLDTRALRRRVAELRLDNATLLVKNERGPHIVCVTGLWSRVSRK